MCEDDFDVREFASGTRDDEVGSGFERFVGDLFTEKISSYEIMDVKIWMVKGERTSVIGIPRNECG
jgi:hypothetical protein